VLQDRVGTPHGFARGGEGPGRAAEPMMVGSMSRSGSLGPIVGLLVLFGACLGSRQAGPGCGCGAAAAPEAVETVTPATAPSSEAVPAEAEARPGPPGPDEPGWTRLRSRSGTYEICWRAPDGPIPRNQDFTIEAWVLRDGAPLREGILTVTAWMPDHGHGMLRRPSSQRQPDGSFRIEGLLLHMRGHWEVFFEVLEGTLSETADYELDL